MKEIPLPSCPWHMEHLCLKSAAPSTSSGLPAARAAKIRQADAGMTIKRRINFIESLTSNSDIGMGACSPESRRHALVAQTRSSNLPRREFHATGRPDKNKQEL